MSEILTNEALTKERNIFLLGVIALFVLIQAGRLTMPQTADGVAIMGVSVIIKAVLMTCLVFRLSRFLRQPWWMTLVYCLLAPISVLYLIPVVGLLLAVRSTRKDIIAGGWSGST